MPHTPRAARTPGGLLLVALALSACQEPTIQIPDTTDCVGDDCPPGIDVTTPCIAIEPGVLAFGEVQKGQPAPELTFTIGNPCAGELVVQELVLASTLEDEEVGFEVVDPPDAPLTIAAQQAVTLTVRPLLPRFGRFSDRLQITSNDPNFPEDIVALTADAVCVSAELDYDGDGDAIPDGCDTCPNGDDRRDADADGVADACDRCLGHDDRLDRDRDTVPDACDACPGGDDLVDTDGDSIADDCDVCLAGDNFLDADRDTVPDACDLCEGVDDRIDLDHDDAPDGGCDLCPAFDDRIDLDGDGVPGDGGIGSCDVCEGFPDSVDLDGDGVPGDGTPGSCDRCEGSDDRIDDDGDGVPNGCDRCILGDDAVDSDSDGIADACDACPGFDDALDADADGRPDACDACVGGDDAVDTDADGVADFCDACAGFPDGQDADGDRVPDACDICAGGDDALDGDQDGVPDTCDVCEGAADQIDTDGDAVPDGCDRCAGFDDSIDADRDTVPDACDACPGEDDLADQDGDGLPDACDPCPVDDEAHDADLDGVADGCDACPGFDDRLDTDGDTVPDACDACPGADDGLDGDRDTVPDACDLCPGFDDLADVDGDTVPDGCDACDGGDDLVDTDNDEVPNACDLCEGFDDSIDVDDDGRPDREPDCDPCVGADQFEAFPPTPANLVDILVVIDDSCSMAPYQAALGNNFNAFITAMAGVGANWQVGVISTTSPTLRGPVITNGPNAATMFANQVNVGVNGNAIEQGLDRAWQATQPGASAGPGSPFLRSQAVLSLVFVSDEPDQSVLVNPMSAWQYWVSIKGNDQGKVVINGIVAAPPNDGGYNSAIQLAGGQQFDIAVAQWGADLASIAVGSLATQAFPIALVPVPESITVRANGIPMRGWIFDQCSNAILFDGSTRPAAGSLVTVEYVEDCEGVLNGCNDGIDNDGDGLVDYPDEPGCETACDPNELDPVTAPVCANGLDDDGDGDADYPADNECASAAHRYESCSEVDADVFGYRMCEELTPISPCPDLSGTSNRLPLGDEGATGVALGFPFDFYGIDYTTVYVGANGTLSFNSPLSLPNNRCLPAGTQDRTIMVWWDDLNPAGGNVWARTSGAAPRRRFEVQWKVPHRNTGGNLDIRATLQEGTNDIQMCYVDSLSGLGVDNGASATSGIQGNQSVYLTYSCFDGGMGQGRVVRFQHP